MTPKQTQQRSRGVTTSESIGPSSCTMSLKEARYRQLANQALERYLNHQQQQQQQKMNHRKRELVTEGYSVKKRKRAVDTSLLDTLAVAATSSLAEEESQQQSFATNINANTNANTLYSEENKVKKEESGRVTPETLPSLSSQAASSCDASLSSTATNSGIVAFHPDNPSNKPVAPSLSSLSSSSSSVVSTAVSTAVSCATAHDDPSSSVVDNDYSVEATASMTPEQAMEAWKRSVVSQKKKEQQSHQRQKRRRATTTTVTTPNKQDVLFGRGLVQYYQWGNHQLRALCAERRHEYDLADRDDKTVISLQIVHTIQQQWRGRFLKYHVKRKVWKIVHDEVARRKVANVIRGDKPLGKLEPEMFPPVANEPSNGVVPPEQQQPPAANATTLQSSD